MRTGARGSVVMSMGCAGMAWHIAGYGYVTGTAICGRLGVATVACSVTYSGIAHNSAYTLMNVACLEIEAQSRMLEYVTLHKHWWYGCPWPVLHYVNRHMQVTFMVISMAWLYVCMTKVL